MAHKEANCFVGSMPAAPAAAGAMVVGMKQMLERAVSYQPPLY